MSPDLAPGQPPGQPPGRTERVHAASALCVAPHFDDEVLGCGALLAQLVEDGAQVRVLFVSDSGALGSAAGGAKGSAAAGDYAARRRAEAEAVAKLFGFASIETLDLPDGALAAHLEAIAAGIGRAVAAHRPDLLLIPSPLEVTSDHRAAFAALHRLLAPLRGVAPAGSDAEALARLSILAYEVNRPAFPDLLIDATSGRERIEAAMAIYASQEERHPYGQAALGLRRHRTLSLGPEVELAEAYRRLTPADFATRSPAQLVRHLGGVPEIFEVREGPRVSVVVRTKDRPALLAEALASLAANSYATFEVVLVDAGERDAEIAPEFSGSAVRPLVRTRAPQGSGRAGAAQAGVDAATGSHVAFLDDDDLAAPEHLATLAGMVRGAGVRIAYTDAAVAIYELGAAGWGAVDRRLPYSRDFDPDLLLLDNYIPFNTLLIERALLVQAGPFDASLDFFEDWDLLIRLSALAPFHHRAEVTCEYRHFRGAGHHIFGERPRERADFLATKARLYAKHAARLTPAVVARAVDTLRTEGVRAGEEIGSARREAVAERAEKDRARREHAASERRLADLAREHATLARERFAWEERFHAKNGELVALQGERDALLARLGELSREAERLYALEVELRGAATEQGAHLAQTYAEIERLNARLRAMEATRAWRLHLRLERLRGKSAETAAPR